MKYETITLLGGAVVTADISKWSACKKCKEKIVWAVTKTPKNIPIQQDGNGNWIAHFALCAFARDFRKLGSGEGDRLNELEYQKQREKW